MNLKSTKFFGTLLVLGTSFLGLMYDKIGGSEWGTIAVFVMGIYAHHDVKQKEIK